MSHFTLTPTGPFSLAAAAGFVAGFGPAGRPDADGGPVFRLAFVRDDLAGAAGVALREEAGTVRGTMFGPASDPDAVAGQVARILSLDHDGEGFAAVGVRDSVVGRLQRAHPGLRPVLFSSPYEAAAWAVISARQRVSQAVRVRERIEAAAGEPVDVQGEVMPTFPSPRRLLDVSAVPGLSEQQLERLHAVARAALEGRLPRTAARARARGGARRAAHASRDRPVLRRPRARARHGRRRPPAAGRTPGARGSGPGLRPARPARGRGLGAPRRTVAALPHVGVPAAPRGRVGAGGARSRGANPRA